MLNFVMKCPIRFYTISIKRKDAVDRIQLSGKLGKAINDMLSENREYLNSFDNIKDYTDGMLNINKTYEPSISLVDGNIMFSKKNRR